MDFTGKPVLVTGGNGFIGSHLVKELLRQGAVVHVTHRPGSSLSVLENMVPPSTTKLHPIDIRYFKEIDAIFQEEKFDLIYHLASQSDTWVPRPRENFETNVNGVIHLMESLSRLHDGVPVVLAGTVHAVKDNNKQLSSYDESKLEGEHVIDYYREKRNISACIVKNTNTYGSNDLNYNRLIPKTLNDLINRHHTLLKGNGSIRRDFIHVSDVVNAFLTIGNFMLRGERVENNYYLGTGITTPVKDVVSALQRAIPFETKVEWDEQTVLVGRDQDGVRADKLIEAGWSPKKSLACGLSETAEWYLDYFNEN